MSKSQVIALVNQKGGTGKTQSTENLGVGLASEGKKVLLVDMDPQGSLTISLGHPKADELPVTVADIMAKVLREEPIAPGEGILHHPEGVDLMPANISLSGMEVSLVNVMSREQVLKEYIDSVKGNYDYVLIDCMPSLGMLTVNALAAADRLVIPVQAQYLSFLNPEQQKDLLSAIDYAQAIPSLSQAQRIKKLALNGEITQEGMNIILSEEKKQDLDRVTLKHDTLKKYFPKSYTPKQMEDTIIKLLDQWQKKRNRDMER